MVKTPTTWERPRDFAPSSVPVQFGNVSVSGSRAIRNCKLRLFVTWAFLVLMVLYTLAATAGATTLTGSIEFSTNDTGDAAEGQAWNTLGGSPFNLYVTRGSSLDGDFINMGNGAGTSINENLAPGSNNFTLWGDPGAAKSHFALNLFFNGDNTNPGISVFAALDDAPSPPFPSFSANASPSTLTLAGVGVAGAGTLSFGDRENTVTLTQYSWSRPSVFSTDRVGPFSNSPDVHNDFVGQLTLQVNPVPEPSTLLFLSSAVLGLGVMKRLQRAFEYEK